MKKAILCRNRRTGGIVFVNPNIKPVEGSFVAVKSNGRLIVELFNGQACLGVVAEAKAWEAAYEQC